MWENEIAVGEDRTHNIKYMYITFLNLVPSGPLFALGILHRILLNGSGCLTIRENTAAIIFKTL